MHRSFDQASTVAGMGLVASIVVIVYDATKLGQLEGSSSYVLPSIFCILMFSTTTSPIVVQMAIELKLATTEVGHVATISSLINDVFTLTAIGFLSLWLVFFPYDQHTLATFDMLMLLAPFMLIVVGCVTIDPITRWLKNRMEDRQHLQYNQMSIALSFMFRISMCVESMSRSGMLATFLMGTLMPRQGRTR